MFDLLNGLAQISKEPEVVLAHGSAAKEPGTHAEQFIQLHQFSIANEDLVLADQRLDEPLKFSKNLIRKEDIAIVLFLAASIPLLAGK